MGTMQLRQFSGFNRRGWKQLIVQRQCTSVCWAADFLKLNLVVPADR
jgi:hypothetical protein